MDLFPDDFSQTSEDRLYLEKDTEVNVDLAEDGLDQPAVTDLVLRQIFGESTSDPVSPSRKRSARAASLPDSVTDSDRFVGSDSRTYGHKYGRSYSGGHRDSYHRSYRKHKPMASASDITRSKSTPSRIPRPVSGQSSKDISSEVIKTPSSPSISPYGTQAVPVESARPSLYIQENVFQIQCSGSITPGKYRVTIFFLLNLATGAARGWKELIIPGLPRLRSDDCGYLYFWTPPGMGMEFRTSQMKRYSLTECCLMGQIKILPTISVPLRPCDGKFFGWLKDFQVKQTISITTVSRIGLSRYDAVCSINLVQRDFWAEECGFTLFVHGGPDGTFSGHLSELGTFYYLHLKAPDSRKGISEVQIICHPSNLKKFVLSWEVGGPYEKCLAWIPYVSGTRDIDTQVDELKAEYLDALEQNSFQLINLVPPTSHYGLPESDLHGKQSRLLLHFTWGNLRITLEVLIFCIMLALLGSYMSRSGKSQSLVRLAPDLEQVSSIETTLPLLEVATYVSTVQPAQPIFTGNSSPMPLRDRLDSLLGWNSSILHG